MDIIVRYETTDKAHRFVSQIGAFLEDGAHVPATKVKAVTELHFTDLSKEQGEAVITAYGELPEVLGVALDVKPDLAERADLADFAPAPRIATVVPDPLSMADRAWFDKNTKI